MFTVEFEPDASIITTIDDTGECDDVEVILGDDGLVYFRQFDYDANAYEMVILNYQQFLDIFAALNSTEGAFKLQVRRRR
mgnify:CR=1 FL=1|jgi:hypothetical protein